MENDGTVSVPSNISINGREYAIDEAQQLLDLGSKTRDFEKQWNTPVDSLMPAYTKSREELKNLQAERDAARQEIESFKKKQELGTETPTDIKEARKALKMLGGVLDEDLQNGGYIRKDDLDKYFDEKYNAKTQEQRAIDSVLSEADKLEKEINATNPPIPFKKDVVLAYAGAYGITDLKQAYEKMFGDVLGPWRQSQLEAAKKPGLKTLKPIGQKQPEEKRPANDDEYRALLKQTMWGSDEGK